MDMIRQNRRLRITAPLKRWLGDFWSWWCTELSVLLPNSLRRAYLSSQEKLYLNLEGSDLIVSQGNVDDMKPVARYALDTKDTPFVPLDKSMAEQMVVLCLPRDKFLKKSLTLPLAAEENLREVLAFEMDRYTPFTPDMVYYDYTLVARTPGNNSLAVDLFLVSKDELDDLLASVAKFGFKPDHFILRRNQAGDMHPVNLLPAQNRNRKPLLSRFTNITLGILALLLLVGALASPLLQKRQMIRTLEPLLQSASEQAKAAQTLRQEIEQLKTESHFLVDRKLTSLLVLEIMYELTRLLPDDTWVTRLEINGPEVHIQGQSTAAASLIPLLESSPLLQNARFRSPVTREPRTKAERFHLSVEITESSNS